MKLDQSSQHRSQRYVGERASCAMRLRWGGPGAGCRLWKDDFIIGFNTLAQIPANASHRRPRFVSRKVIMQVLPFKAI